MSYQDHKGIRRAWASINKAQKAWLEDNLDTVLADDVLKTVDAIAESMDEHLGMGCAGDLTEIESLFEWLAYNDDNYETNLEANYWAKSKALVAKALATRGVNYA